MDRRSSTLPNSARPSASTPPPPTDDAIEAIIQQATSSRPLVEGRPLRDTRTQLFIGNLPYRVRWQDLKDLFRKAGTVLRADVSLGPDNRSRGFGTVLLATAEDAGRAVDMFNGYSWQTRVLEVRLDRLLPEYDSQFSSMGSSTPSTSSSSPYPPASAPSHLGPGSSMPEEPEYLSTYQGSDPNACRNLFVGNLPFHCQWQDLKDLFRQAGTILRADVALGPDGRSRGFGTVAFATEYDAERAVKMFNGYEYNNRLLKVHYDKFSPASSLPATTSASPVSGSASRNHPSQIKLPPGFMFDYGPPSGPSSPYEMFSLLQQHHQQRQNHQQPSQVLHQPQAHHYQQHSEQQQRQQQRQHLQSQIFNQQSLDIDRLTNSLASSHFSDSSQTQAQAPSSAHKPSPISTTTSSSSTTTTSSSSEHSMSSTSASSLSQSPIPPQHHQQSQNQSPPHTHPRHPGPISLPPLRPPPFPVSPHTPQASGMSLSPLHHPSMGPSYHMYASTSAAAAHSAAYQQHQHSQMVSLTPHGLPPITPSMPPFTLFMPPSPHGMGMVQHHQQQHVASSSRDVPLFTSAGGSSSGSFQPPAASASIASTSPSATTFPMVNGAGVYSSTSTNSNLNKNEHKAAASRQQQQQQYQQYQQPQSFTTPNHFVIPLPSPGLYLPSHSQQPLPSPPIVHPHTHLRLNLSGIPGSFSPGVVMSPGTFYGRPGEANPNPAINMAVGAPVHVHSPGGASGGMAPPTPGHEVMHVQHGHGHPPHVSHGAYFYMVSGPKNAPSGMEPKGYFDPMYFPAGGVAGGVGVGGSALVNEIMQDRETASEKDANTPSSDTVGVNDAGEEVSPPADASVGTGTAKTSASSSSTSLTSWYTSDHDRKVIQSHSADAVNESVLNEGSTISRTHSVGYTKKAPAPAPVEVPRYGRGNSDPLQGAVVVDSGSTSDDGVGKGQIMPLKLPARVPWSRRTADPGEAEVSTSTSSPPPQLPPTQ